MIMEQLQPTLALIEKAIDEGRGITIKMDDILITAESITANGLEITIDAA